MAVFKRYKRKKITSDDPNWKDARWTVEFELRGRRVHQSLPEARTQKDAERAEIKLREDVYNRKYGIGKSVLLTKFFADTYLPWLKDEGSETAYRNAVSRGKLLTSFFADRLLQDVTSRDCERFKAAVKKEATPSGTLRSGATANRYMSLLSAVFTRAITEEVATVNPCARLDDDPEQGRERYLDVEEERRLKAVLIGDLEFLRAPLYVSLGTGLRKNVELLKLKIEHMNFTARSFFCSVRGGNVEIPPGWLIVAKGKGGKYRLVPMNSEIRPILLELTQGRKPNEFVFGINVNGVSEYTLRSGFEEACDKAGIVLGKANPGGVIWHDLRRTFATRLRAHGAHEYDIQDLLGHARHGVTKVYARATIANLEQAVEKLTQPLGQVVEFGRKAG